MKLYEISQLPVLEGGKVIGIIDESDLLLAVYGHPDRFRDLVSSAMTTRVDAVQASDSLAQLIVVFVRDHAAIVMDGTEFLGLITRIDLLNHLRRSIA